MEFSEVVKNRRSIRRYKQGAEVSDADIQKILEAAMLAPSACNTRPWEFVVIKSRETLKKITEVHPYTQMLNTASAAIVVCGLPDRQSGMCAGFWPQDCGACTAHILLQAKDLGYGTCWCGVYPNEQRCSDLKAIVNTEGVPFCVIALGVSDENPEARGKFEAEKVRFM